MSEWWLRQALSASLRRRIRRRRILRYSLPVVSPYTDRLRDLANDGHRCTQLIVDCRPRPEEKP